MSDISLPTEVLNQILQEAVIGMRPSERDKNYSSFSLVSKNWTSIATSHLLKSLKVRNGNHTKQVLDGIDRSGLGSIGKSLEVVFRKERDYLVQSNDPPNPSQIIEGDMVSVEQFVQLTRSLPSLTQIKLIRPTFIRFKRQDFKDYPDIFKNLITFHLDTFYYRIKSEVLTNIMTLAPNLINLELKQERYHALGLAPLKQCNPLRSLKSYSDEVDSQIISSKYPLIPYSSLEGLKELQLYKLRTLHPGYNAFILKVAPTLTSLILTNREIKYPVIVEVIRSLPFLASIEVYCYEEVRVDFFTRVPLSLSIIKSLRIGLPALQYLKNNQRPGLKLHQISTTSFALDSPLELIEALPKSLVVLSIFGHTERFENLLESLESLVGTANYPSSLKIINGPPDSAAGGVLPNHLIPRFARLGISLKRLC